MSFIMYFVNDVSYLVRSSKKYYAERRWINISFRASMGSIHVIAVVDKAVSHKIQRLLSRRLSFEAHGMQLDMILLSIFIVNSLIFTAKYYIIILYYLADSLENVHERRFSHQL